MRELILVLTLLACAAAAVRGQVRLRTWSDLQPSSRIACMFRLAVSMTTIYLYENNDVSVCVGHG